MKHSQFFRQLLLFFVVVLISVCSFAQKTVKGTVKDKDGEPLIGANVLVKGTSNGLITDLDGQFIISNVDSKSILVFSFIGYDSQSIVVGDKSVINVVLKESSVLMDEVMVVGYAQGSKRTVSGAVERVKKEDMNSGVITTPLDALKGKVAGLVISQSGGDPLAASSVRIRGTSSLSGGSEPLIIIDGVFGDMDMFNAIAPGDIEAVTVLKDASETAQYGSRGASGVIVVQTSRGKLGYAQIEYNGFVGFNTVYKNIDMLSADEYRALGNEMGVTFKDLGSNTNWFDEIERNVGITQTHNLSFTSGSENANMRASLGYIERQGALRNSDMKNYTLKMDATQFALNKKLKFDLGLFGSERDGQRQYDMQHMFYAAAAFNPTFPNHVDDSNFWTEDYDASEIFNPLGQLQIENRYDVMSINTHGKVTWKILDGLNLAAFGSYTYMNISVKRYIPTNIEQGRTIRGRAHLGAIQRKDLMGNIQLNYTKDFGKHHIDALALMEGQKYSTFSNTSSETGFDTDYFKYNNMQAGAIVSYGDNTSNAADYMLSSYMGRLNYVFDGKYIATVNVRTDGSSKLGSGQKWGVFPSASVGWVISNEKFMKNLRMINSLKLRAGYGVTGNQDAISPYNSLQKMSPSGTTSVNGVNTTTFSITSNSNPDLKWEVKHTFDVGLDMSMFKNRLNLSIDYYRSTTKDMLYTYSVSVPPFTYGTLLANMGEMSNNGLEIALSGDIFKSKDFTFSAGMNVSFQKNKLESLSGTYRGEELTTSEHIALAYVKSPGLSQNNGVTYLMEGQPVGVFYLPHCTGISKEGKYIMEDLDGSGQVDLSDSGDRYVAGQAMPKAFANMHLNFKFKNWDLTAQFNGAFGHKIYNGTASAYNNLDNFPTYNMMKGVERMNDGNGIHDIQVSDYWLEKGDYVNFEYLTLGYTFNQKSLPKTCFIKNLRLSLSVNNICTITGYSGMTPMINSANIAPQAEGTTSYGTLGVDDKRIYPLTRTFSFSASIKF